MCSAMPSGAVIHTTVIHLSIYSRRMLKMFDVTIDLLVCSKIPVENLSKVWTGEEQAMRGLRD
jgi:hypothetical protein